MDRMNALTRLARPFGDGLVPELQELLLGPLPTSDYGKVVDLAAIRGQRTQAGPNPIGALPQDLPENVVLFRTSVAQRAPKRPVPDLRAPRKSRGRRLINRKD